jgi:hypothetical protein
MLFFLAFSKQFATMMETIKINEWLVQYKALCVLSVWHILFYSNTKS